MVTVGIEVSTNEEIIAVLARAMAAVMAAEVAVAGALATTDREVHLAVCVCVLFHVFLN